MTEERKQELAQLLAEAQKHLKTEYDSSSLQIDVCREYLRHYDAVVWMRVSLHIANETIKLRLLEFIREEFSKFIHNDTILSVTSFLLGVQPQGCPLDYLLRQLLKIALSRGIEDAVSQFSWCTSKDAHDSFQFAALVKGIKITREIQVYEAIRLVPLPESLLELPSHLRHKVVPSYVSAKELPWDSLLTINGSISPLFYNPSLIDLERNPDEMVKRAFCVKINDDEYSKQEEIDKFPLNFGRALSLACNAAVQIGPLNAIFAEDKLYNLDPIISTAWQRRPFGSTTDVGNAHINHAVRLHHLLRPMETTEEKHWNRLRIAIDRWTKSKEWKDSVDKIIDLGIAFECVYLSDGSRDELRYRLAHRGAWHLGKAKHDRQVLFQDFKKLYDWRSSAVHTGKLPHKKGPFSEQEAEEFISTTQDLCRRSILKIIKDGRFPDWENLVLG